MYELFIAFKYLIPKKKALSTSLISLVSIFVIALVVWLILLFLSVTDGIEKNWLDKLTTLNAPIRISAKSEKADIQEAFIALSKIPKIKFEEYQISGALMRLTLNRDNKLSFISQMTYLTNFCEQNKKLKKLILPNAKPLSENETSVGIYLPKSFQESGVLLGDKGYFAYLADTGISSQELHINIEVNGFYDPGVLPIGNRFSIVPMEVAKTISYSTATFSQDGSPMHGIYVWCDDLANVDVLKKSIEESIGSFWKVDTYKDYEFSKDLLQQFQSDKLLFTLIAIIILIVACSNIISFLVLLVNDKRKEIAILQAMGAKKSNVAFIFGFCGAFLGTMSSAIGICAAIFTLHHLDGLVAFLGSIQGHSAFNVAFFGNRLPNELSMSALYFVLIATPLVATISGLIPAIKAAKLSPSSILRSE